MAENAKTKAKNPTIVSGRQIRDGWYVMGGNSYMAQIFKDAGADYIMKDKEETGGVTLDFESVYAKAVGADFWQIDGSFDGEFTLEELEAEDSRYADLKAFKDKHVLFCNFATTPYRELSPVEPHILLADFVKAFHPEVLPHYQPKYYKIIHKHS
jgi:iron complex transport system substrate-binding protein